MEKAKQVWAVVVKIVMVPVNVVKVIYRFIKYVAAYRGQ